MSVAVVFVVVVFCLFCVFWFWFCCVGFFSMKAPKPMWIISVIVTPVGNLRMQSQCGWGWRRPLEIV